MKHPLLVQLRGSVSAEKLAHWTRSTGSTSRSSAFGGTEKRVLQELFISLQALCRGAADNRGNGAPLRWHELGEMQQLLILLPGPLCLLYARVQPLVPAGFALFGRLANQQRRDSCPLVQAIFHDRCLKNFILQRTQRLRCLENSLTYVGQLGMAEISQGCTAHSSHETDCLPLCSSKHHP